MNILTETMTTIHVGPWRVRVWRGKRPEAAEGAGGLELSGENRDLWEAAKSSLRDNIDPEAVAKLFIGMERVNAVEVVDHVGAGVVLYRDWP